MTLLASIEYKEAVFNGGSLASRMLSTGRKPVYKLFFILVARTPEIMTLTDCRSN